MLLQIRELFCALAIPIVGLGGCASAEQDPVTVSSVNHERLLRDLAILSHDSLRGRLTGSHGNRIARNYISNQFADAGLTAYDDSFEQTFEIDALGDSALGVNLVGYVPGTGTSDLVIVISAHFDHLGVRDGNIFNGADDNASGTAALLELARFMVQNPLTHTTIFLAADAEESGLRGARAFVQRPPVPRDRIAVNVNMDMISRSDSVLFAAGTHHYPGLRGPLQTVADRTNIALRFGHDTPGLPAGGDWTNSSDHAPFHEVGIPFVYFGVEDHPGYHQPTDDFEAINPDFYVAAVEMILDAIMEIDANLEVVVSN